jgi:hypothetical protein
LKDVRVCLRRFRDELKGFVNHCLLLVAFQQLIMCPLLTTHTHVKVNEDTHTHLEYIESSWVDDYDFLNE